MSFRDQFFRIKALVSYYGKAVDLHGIHSPFVYNLVKDCVYDPTAYPEYRLIDDYRGALIHSSEEYTPLDLGAGSRSMRNKRSKIGEVAKVASSNRTKARLLFRLSRYFRSAQILELGTNLGVGTLALHLGNKDAELVSVEGDPFLFEFVKKNFPGKADLINENFDDYLQDFLKYNTPGLVYVDGNHTYDATLEYFNLIAKPGNDGVVIFDDIYWSEGMAAAWNMIRADARTAVSIDLFSVGIVSLRQGQRKQDFTVRF